MQKAKAEIDRAQADLEAMRAQLEQLQRALQDKAKGIEKASKDYAKAKLIAKLQADAGAPAQPGTRPPTPVNPGAQSESLDRRIGVMEKKLDLILEELKALKGGSSSPAPTMKGSSPKSRYSR